jgi:MarR family transcriptional regulator for hemolysin
MLTIYRGPAVLQYDFEESISYWICMTGRAIEEALNEELAPHGITFRQCQVLFWLAYARDLTQSDLAERMQVEAPTLVGILDRMERAGWITREPDTRDRRKKWIRPTPRIQPVWRKMVACARRVRARATRGMSARQVKLAMRLLARIQANLRQPKPVAETVG